MSFCNALGNRKGMHKKYYFTVKKQNVTGMSLLHYSKVKSLIISNQMLIVDITHQV